MKKNGAGAVFEPFKSTLLYLSLRWKPIPSLFYFSVYRYGSTSSTVIIVIRDQSLWSSRFRAKGGFHEERRKRGRGDHFYYYIRFYYTQTPTHRLDLPFHFQNCGKFPWDSNVIATILPVLILKSLWIKVETFIASGFYFCNTIVQKCTPMVHRHFLNQLFDILSICSITVFIYCNISVVLQ